MLYGFLFVGEMLLLVYCVLSIITTPENECRNLPKLLWLLLVIMLPLAGGIAWLLAGRPVAAASLPYQGNQGTPRQPASYPSPRTATPASPDDDEAFLRGLRERAEEQRRRAKDDGTP